MDTTKFQLLKDSAIFWNWHSNHQLPKNFTNVTRNKIQKHVQSRTSVSACPSRRLWLSVQQKLACPERTNMKSSFRLEKTVVDRFRALPTSCQPCSWRSKISMPLFTSVMHKEAQIYWKKECHAISDYNNFRTVFSINLEHLQLHRLAFFHYWFSFQWFHVSVSLTITYFLHSSIVL